MSLVWRCLRRYRWYCLTALLFVLLEANCELLLPPLMARMIDEGVRTGELGRVLELGGWMAVAALAGILCVLVRNFCSGTASQRFGAELRRTLFAKCLRLTEGGVDQLGSGALVTRMSSDCDQLSRSVNSALRIGVKAPALCVGSVVYAMGLDMGLSWIVLAVVLGVTALITAYLAESGRRFRRVREAMDRVNTTVEEFLRGIRLIRALGREEWENRRFQASNGELEESGIRLQLLQHGQVFHIAAGIAQRAFPHSGEHAIHAAFRQLFLQITYAHDFHSIHHAHLRQVGEPAPSHADEGHPDATQPGSLESSHVCGTGRPRSRRGGGFPEMVSGRDFHSLPGEGISGGSRSGRKPQRFEKLSA